MIETKVLRGSVIVAVERHSSTAMHGTAEGWQTYRPLVVTRVNRDGLATEGRAKNGSPVKLEHMTRFVVPADRLPWGAGAQWVLNRLDDRYDTIDEVRSAIVSLSTVEG